IVTANMRRAVTDDKLIREARERGNADVSRSVASAAVPVSTENMDHFTMPDGWKQKMERRQNKKWLPVRPTSPQDRDVTNKLESTVSVAFRNKPLGDVLHELQDMTKVNIVPDLQNLQTDNISLDLPVSIQLDKVRLKTALELMLKNARLTYVVHDG